jgi:hypothetical protein
MVEGVVEQSREERASESLGVECRPVAEPAGSWSEKQQVRLQLEVGEPADAQLSFAEFVIWSPCNMRSEGFTND